MPDYRCYFLNQRDKIFRAEIVEADLDDAAVVAAERLLKEKPEGSAVEVWLLNRRVRTIRR